MPGWDLAGHTVSPEQVQCWGARDRERRFWPSWSFIVCQLVCLKLWATYGALTTS